jgi:hypothetical protein
MNVKCKMYPKKGNFFVQMVVGFNELTWGVFITACVILLFSVDV